MSRKPVERSAVGQQLLARRRALQLSQREAAAKIGISFPYLCQIETGKVGSITLTVGLAIAKAYGLSISELGEWAATPHQEHPKCSHCGQEIDQ
jgi:transcriptional regulator with XRE-family HTH domain